MSNRPTHKICLKRDYEAKGETKSEWVEVGKAWYKDNGKLYCTLFSGDGAVSIAGDFHILPYKEKDKDGAEDS